MIKHVVGMGFFDVAYVPTFGFGNFSGISVTVSAASLYGLTITNAALYGLTITNTYGTTGETPVAYDIGDVARLSAAFLDSASAAADPTSVNLVVQRPDESEISLSYASAEIVKDSTGNYHYDLTLTQEGTWYYRFVGVGSVVAAEESSFEVQESVF